MIQVEEALDLVEKFAIRADSKKVSLTESLGLILAEDVISPINMPPFNQSAMDGYAVNYDPAIENYVVLGEIQAGGSNQFVLDKGQAVRIFTGAAVPDSANMVVRQEDVSQIDQYITFTAPALQANIRPKGEQIKQGENALHKGVEINPATIGFLATLGLSEVVVHPRPKVAILTTGNELIKPGEELAFGKIYESNSIMLEAAFHHYGFRDIEHVLVPDSYELTVDALRKSLNSVDMIILSGGISVGDYDFVQRALNELDVAQVFYKVNQKPGKPLYFGTYQKKLIFALPGNPAAALTSFYLYILPALNQITGGNFEGCVKTELPISTDYKKKGTRTEILKAFATDTEVKILGAQSSAMLSSFSEANALVVIPDDIPEVEEGDFVLTLLL